MSESKYAGFWLRFVAWIIDYIILYVINGFVIIPILATVGLSIGAASEGFDLNTMTEGDIIAAVSALVGAIFAGGIISLIISILYYSIMEASKHQATVGKIALGLKVTDMNGGKLDIGKAALRQIGKIVSGIIIMIGYIMAGFTEKKQALHDMIAGALVVKK